MNIDPITIILFLIFFVAPIVNNFLRRGQGGQRGQGQQGQGRPQGRPTGAPQRREQERPDERNAERNTSADTRQEGGSVGDEFSRRLEEARRRVQEAMGGSDEGGRTQSRGGSQSGRDDSSGDLFPRLDEEQQARSQGSRSQQGRASQQGRGLESGRARQPFEGLGREGVSRQRPASQQGTTTKQSSVDRTELGDAPPLRVQRLKPRRGSKIDGPRGVLEFDRRSVLQGIIWREILDEPLSKRKRRKRR